MRILGTAAVLNRADYSSGASSRGRDEPLRYLVAQLAPVAVADAANFHRESAHVGDVRSHAHPRGLFRRCRIFLVAAALSGAARSVLGGRCVSKVTIRYGRRGSASSAVRPVCAARYLRNAGWEIGHLCRSAIPVRSRLKPDWFARSLQCENRYRIAIGLIIACTAPVMREGPSTNRNS